MKNPRETAELTLFLTAALAGEPTENIRAVTTSERGNLINLRFILYRPPSEDEIEIMGYIGTEFISNYNDKFISEKYEIIPDGEIFLEANEFIVDGKG